MELSIYLESIPKLRDVFQLYCSLEPGLTVKDLCYRHEPSRLGIDERSANSFVVGYNTFIMVQQWEIVKYNSLRTYAGRIHRCLY